MNGETWDPRGDPNHEPRHLPFIDGEPLRWEETGTEAATRRRFAMLYYRLNLDYHRLRVCRQADRGAEVERSILRGIETTLRERDAFENECLSSGIVCEPVMERGFARDLVFTFPGTERARSREAGRVRLVVEVPVPMPRVK